MDSSIDLIKALADPVRLRIIRAVSQAELSVAELVEVLSLPQSTVSRHLKPLRDTQLLETRREGTSIYYRRGSALGQSLTARFVDEQANLVDGGTTDEQSIRRILQARNQRSRDFFDRVAGQYSGLTEPGGGWPALATALAASFRGQEVADLGSGEGALTMMLARYAARVSAVDTSPEMLRHLKQAAEAAGYGKRVQTIQGDLTSLPLANQSVDAVFISQVLHHVAEPQVAIREAARILRPKGLLIVLDLDRHEQEWVREEWADHWLGFSTDQIADWMKAVGLRCLNGERLAGATADLAVILVTGEKY